MFGRFLNVPLQLILMSFIISIIICFSHLEPRQASEREIFGGNGRRISATDYFREKASSQMFDRFLDALLNSNVMLLYYQYHYSLFICLFCYFIISVVLSLLPVLIASNEQIKILWQKVVICHPLCHKLEMWKLIVILVIIN